MHLSYEEGPPGTVCRIVINLYFQLLMWMRSHKKLALFKRVEISVIGTSFSFVVLYKKAAKCRSYLRIQGAVQICSYIIDRVGIEV